MARKKGYLSLLSKGVRGEVDVIMRERDGALAFPELVTRSWDLDPRLWRSPFKNETDRDRCLDEWRASWAARRPAWTAAQIDDAIRLEHVAVYLPEIAIARRCALDDPGELVRLLIASHRLMRTVLCNDCNRPAPETICAVGDIPLAQQIVAGRSAGYTVIPQQDYLHEDAVYALLQQDRQAFERLLGEIPPLTSRNRGLWLEGIYVAFRGVAQRRPDEVARGLTVHIEAVHRMRLKDALDGAVNLQAHGLYRLFVWVSPELVSAFDAAQPFPWDAALHAWVSAHPDPVAGWDLSGTPPLIQQIVGRGEVPVWLRPADRLYEIVLLGGDPGSRPLLEEVEGLAGGDGSLKSAKRILGLCPVVLRWGLPEEEDGRDFLETARRRIEASGGQTEVRPMRPGVCRHFLPPLEGL